MISGRKAGLVCLAALMLVAACAAVHSDITPIKKKVIPLMPAIQEDCIRFSPVTAEVKQINGRWTVVDGSMAMINFDGNEAEARTALRIIKHYRMDSQCFVGRPNAPMQYYLVNGKSPEGPVAGEDAIQFNPATIEAKLVNGNWKVVDGSHWMLDFGASEANARKAVNIIRKYDFTHICYVGRPDAPMMYFRKNVSAPQISAKLTADPVKYTGAFPALIKFNGTITADKACTVKYTFTRSDGATGPTHDLVFSGAGTKNVQTTWQLGKDYTGWQAIKVTAPAVVESNKAQFEIASAPAPATEDCVTFNPNTTEVKQINGRWKVVDGDHWIMDFESNESEARTALSVIKKHGFSKICFVGRPDPSMTYFLK